MSIPAGWYDDGSGHQRWWDGARWTELVAPPQPFAPPAAAPPPPAAPAAAPPSQGSSPPAQQFTPPGPGFTPPGQGFTPPAQGFTPPSAAAQAPWPMNSAYAPPPASGHPLASPPRTMGVSGLGWAALAVSVAGAVLAFVPLLTAFGALLLVAGIVLSIVALVRPGVKWPGITGLIVSALGLVVAGIVLVVSFVGATLTGISEGMSGDWPDPVDSPSSAPADGQFVDWWEVEVGDCLAVDQPFYGDDGRLLVVPCDTPHGEEVYYEYDMTQQDFPGDEDTEAESDEVCEGAFADFVGVPYEDSLLDFFAYWPSEDSFASGDRRVQCMVYEPGTEVTGTLAGAKR